MKRAESVVWQLDLGGVIALILMTLMAYAVIVKPIQHEQLELTKTRAALGEQQQIAAVLSQQHATLEARMRQNQQEKQEANLELKSLQQLNTRLAQITAIVEEAGMIIDETETGAGARHQWYQTVPITVTGSGSYPSCAAVLHHLHERMPDLGLTALTLSGNPRHPGAPAQYELDLVWYAAPAVALAGE